MIRFADEALIEVRSGKGGNGCVAFRREKYIPKGGPAGGAGGRGGDVVFILKHNLRTLSHLRFKRVYKAHSGGDGEGSNRHGADGQDVLIPVPPGTTIKDPETDEILFDFGINRAPTASPDEEEARFVYLRVGKGGWGNARFKTAVNQAPRFAHEGTEGETKKLLVELSIMADIGLVGFPNAGKSSLLDYFTNARPKIAPYPFTTKIPNLGVLHIAGRKTRRDLSAADDSERDIIIADIPGIIEGAADGAGLGGAFLKHISRCQALLVMIDCADDSCFGAYDILLDEISRYGDGSLAQKKRIVLCNKIDADGAEERAKTTAARIAQNGRGESVFLVSIHERRGLKAVEAAVAGLVQGDGVLEKAKKSEERSFLLTRSVADDRPEQFPGGGAEEMQ